MDFFDNDDDKKKKFKDRLLTVLEDAEVQEKLRAVLAAGGEAPKALPDAPKTDSCPAEPERKQMADWYREKLREAKETISQLEKEIKDISYEKNRMASRCQTVETELTKARAGWQSDKDAYGREYGKLSAEKEDCERQLRQQRQEMERQQAAAQEAEAIAAPFAEALDLYRQVQGLPVDLKERVQAYFQPRTAVAFLVCLGQKGNLIPLWDIINDEMGNCSTGDRTILLALLAYSVDRVNDSLKMPQYALRKDKVGATFDANLQSRSRDSSRLSDCPVKEVILPGIEYAGKVERKSVVRV